MAIGSCFLSVPTDADAEAYCQQQAEAGNPLFVKLAATITKRRFGMRI